jgi:hypothetical protein
VSHPFRLFRLARQDGEGPEPRRPGRPARARATGIPRDQSRALHLAHGIGGSPARGQAGRCEPIGKSRGRRRSRDGDVWEHGRGSGGLKSLGRWNRGHRIQRRARSITRSPERAIGMECLNGLEGACPPRRIVRKHASGRRLRSARLCGDAPNGAPLRSRARRLPRSGNSSGSQVEPRV